MQLKYCSGLVWKDAKKCVFLLSLNVVKDENGKDYEATIYKQMV